MFLVVKNINFIFVANIIFIIIVFFSKRIFILEKIIIYLFEKHCYLCTIYRIYINTMSIFGFNLCQSNIYEKSMGIARLDYVFVRYEF